MKVYLLTILKMEDFNQKSIKIREIVGKLYTLREGKFLN